MPLHRQPALAELAATVKARKQTVLEYLDELYVEVGHHGERLINKVIEGRRGVEQIQELMSAFRVNPPHTIGGLRITEVYDYGRHEIRSLEGGAAPRALPSPSGDLLIFRTEATGTRFAARPSGTEPKIKFYLFARTSVPSHDKLGDAKAATAHRLDAMAADIEQFIKRVLAS